MKIKIMLKALLGATLALSALHAPLASAEDLEFKLINRSSTDLVGFYVSRSGTNEWEENLIEGAYLPAGNIVSVLIADGLDVCNYDIRGEFSDESEAEDYDINLCDLGEYTFTDWSPAVRFFCAASRGANPKLWTLRPAHW